MLYHYLSYFPTLNYDDMLCYVKFCSLLEGRIV